MGVILQTLPWERRDYWLSDYLSARGAWATMGVSGALSEMEQESKDSHCEDKAIEYIPESWYNVTK